MSRKKYKKELTICDTKIQAINNLKKFGFCLIKNAISKNDTIELKNKLKKSDVKKIQKMYLTEKEVILNGEILRLIIIMIMNQIKEYGCLLIRMIFF